MECDPEETSPEYAMISDWVMYEKGTRYKLAEHLREAGLTRVSTMYVFVDGSYTLCNMHFLYNYMTFGVIHSVGF